MQRLRTTVLGFAFSACATSGNESLIGNDIDAVRARLGPPLQATAGGGAWSLGYHDRRGNEVPDAVLVVDDVVVRVAPDLVPNADVAGPERLLGARIEKVLEALGPARGMTVGTAGQTLDFGDLTLVVHEGRVVACR